MRGILASGVVKRVTAELSKIGILCPMAPVLKVLLVQAESAVLLELSRTKSSSKHAFSWEFHTSLLKRIVVIIIFRGRCYCVRDTA